MPNATSARHALRALTHLASRAEPVPAAHIARALDLPRSSTYHLLAVLVEQGYAVHYAEERTYGIGAAVHLSLIHISEPTRRLRGSRMPSSA